jgi:hypothetical protein
MFQATYTPVSAASEAAPLQNCKKFRGGKFYVSVMHGSSFDDKAPIIFGKGPRYTGRAVIQNIRGRTLGKTDVEKGRLEAWNGEFHWVGYDSDLNWMKITTTQPTEMQIIVYDMNRTDKSVPFGRSTFNCQFFPDDCVYKCILPIETIPDMMGNSTIIGSLCANIQFVGVPDAKKLKVGESFRIDPTDNDSIIMRVGYDQKGHIAGKYTATLTTHGKKGEFLHALNGTDSTADGSRTKISVRTIEIGDEGRISDNPRRAEMDITIKLDTVEDHISSFFLVLTADNNHTTLQDLENVSCSTFDAATGTALSHYDVAVDVPATAMVFSRLVKNDMNSKKTVMYLTAVM